MVAHHVGVSIVNYKTASLVQECLQSLAQMNVQSAKVSVCVVDNASGDGSAEQLSAFIAQPSYSPWVTFIAAPKNGGFSYGNNVAAEYFKDKNITHFWLLNPDAAPRAGALDELLHAMAGLPECAIAGSRLEDEDGTEQIAAFNYPTPLGEFVNTLKLNWLSRRCSERVIAVAPPKNKAAVDWVAGASMLIRWPVLMNCGFMDENYFLYFEEVDLCLAVKNKGFSTLYVPQSRVVHHVGAATGISDMRKQAPRRPQYWFDSRRRFFQKNYGFTGALLADVAWLAGYSLFRLKAIVKGQVLLDPPYFMRDFLKYSSLVKGRCV